MLLELLLGGLFIGGTVYLKGKEVLESDEVRDQEGVNKAIAAGEKLGTDFQNYVEKEAAKMEKKIEKERKRREGES